MLSHWRYSQIAKNKQQSRLIAMMQDFDRTLELVDISENSHGATLAQQAKYMDGMEAKITLMKNAYEGFIQSLTNNELIIGGVEAITKLLEFAADTSGVLIPVALALVGYGAVQLVQKQKIKQLEFEISKEETKRQLAEAEAALEEKKQFAVKQEQAKWEAANDKANAARREKKAADDEAELERIKLRNLRDEQNAAQKNGDTAKAKALEAQIESQQMALGIAKQKAQAAATNVEITEKEEKIAKQNLEAAKKKSEVDTKDAELQVKKLKLLDQQNTLSLRNIISIASAIIKKRIETTARKANAKAINEENAALDANTKKMVENGNSNIFATFKGGITKALSSIKSFLSSGGATLIAIVAAIALIVAGVKKLISHIEKVKNPLDEVNEKLEQLQVNLYNLTQKKVSVAKLADEFEELSNKIALSAEETEKLQEIITSVNDTAGFNLITATTTEGQLEQIRAYETALSLQQQQLIEDQNKTIGKEYKKLGNLDWNAAGTGALIGGGAGLGAAAAGMAIGAAAGSVVPVAGTIVGAIAGLIIGAATGASIAADVSDGLQESEKAQKKYLEEFANSASGKEALNSIGKQQIEGLVDAGEETQEAVLQMFRDQFANLLTNEGVDVDKFTQDMGINKNFIQELDMVLDEETTLAEKWTYIQELQNSGINQELVDSLKSANVELGILSKLSEETAIYFSQIEGFSESLDSVWKSVSKVLKTAGKDSEEISTILSGIFEEAAEAANGVDESKSTQVFNQGLVSGTIAAMKESVMKAAEETDTVKLQQELDEKLEEIEKAQKKLDKIKDTDSDKYQAKQKQINDLTAEYNELNDQLYLATHYEEVIQDSTFDILSVYDTGDISEVTDAMDKLNSKIERLINLTDLASMSGADLLQLIRDYPEYVDKIISGGSITAVDVMEQVLDDVNELMKNNEILAENAQDKLDTAVREGIYSQDWISLLESTPDFFSSGTDRELMAQLAGIDSETFDKLRSDWDSLQTAMAVLKMNQLKYGATDQSKLTGAFGDAVYGLEKLYETSETKISAIQSAMKLLDETSTEYVKNQEALITEYGKQASSVSGQIKEITDKIDLSEYGGAIILNKDTGLYEIDYKVLEGADQDLKNRVQTGWTTIITTQNEKLQELYGNLTTSLKNAADQYTAILENQTEELNQELENRKEAYEKYFDELDELEEEQERTQDRESIIKQIQALSGGADAASKSKIKELKQQLDDLNKEALQAQREAQREAITQNIDEQIESNTEELDNTTKKILQVLYSLSTGGEIPADVLKYLQEKFLGYASGGMVDYTGLAMLHGTKQHPEAVLSAEQTALVRNFMSTLQSSQQFPNSGLYSASGMSNNVVIEKVEIRPNQLNNNQDWQEAAGLFAETFNTIIRKGGLNVNVKK